MSAIDRGIETVLVIFFWAVQIGITAGIALLFGWLLKQAESVLRRKPGHLLPWTLCAFAVLCAILAALALNPPVACPDEYKDDLTPEIYTAVQTSGRGIYSRNIPLVPAFVKIKEIRECTIEGKTEPYIRFDINYLYFGQVGISFSWDGYNIEKPLSGLQ